MGFPRSFVLLFLLFLGSTAAAQVSSSLRNEQLRGPFAVGFRREWRLDDSRFYAATFKDGQTYGVKAKQPRPILINIWYPPAKNNGPRMTHSRYLDLRAELHDPRLARLQLPCRSMNEAYL